MIALLLACTFSASPNVVFLSVDTLRADHLGCYGYPHATSPHIDEFAESALVFEDCVCEVPLTAPSFSSMLASRYPRTTGVVRNGLPLPENIPLLTEAFQQAGYQTFCVQSNWTLKKKLSGLARGFDEYEDDFKTKRWGFMKAERYADEVTRVALERLEERDPARPFFCWIHYSDPHAPYRWHRSHNVCGTPLRKLGKEEKAAARYDSEIAFTDHHLGRLLEAIPAENTYVLLVSDHGESLYEHDYLGHGRRIYQPGLHIVLILRGPGIDPGHSTSPARGVDVGVTVLGMAGLPVIPGMVGLDLLAAPPAAGRIRVVETYGGAVPKFPGARALMASRPPMRMGVLAKPWKLILRGPQDELFNLDTDEKEMENLYGSTPDRVAELEALVNEWDEQNPRVIGDEADLSDEDIRALEAGGYM